MRRTLPSMLIGGFVIIHAGTSHAMIDITACGEGSAAVTTANAGGDWIGFSARTKDGRIIDAPPQKMDGLVGSGGYNFDFEDNGSVSEARASTWEDYDSERNKMEGRRADTGWVPCD